MNNKHIIIRVYLLIPFIISVLNACTAIDPAATESYVKDTSVQPPKVITTAIISQPVSVKQTKNTSFSSSGQAVLELLAQSKSAMEKNHYDEAEHLLARALRIEPSNAWLWHDMAVLKFYQGDYQQAIQQALKSNNLEKNIPHLKADNEKIIKQSYIEIENFKKTPGY